MAKVTETSYNEEFELYEFSIELSENDNVEKLEQNLRIKLQEYSYSVDVSTTDNLMKVTAYGVSGADIQIIEENILGDYGFNYKEKKLIAENKVPKKGSGQQNQQAWATIEDFKIVGLTSLKTVSFKVELHNIDNTKIGDRLNGLRNLFGEGSVQYDKKSREITIYVDNNNNINLDSIPEQFIEGTIPKPNKASQPKSSVTEIKKTGQRRVILKGSIQIDENNNNLNLTYVDGEDTRPRAKGEEKLKPAIDKFEDMKEAWFKDKGYKLEIKHDKNEGHIKLSVSPIDGVKQEVNAKDLAIQLVNKMRGRNLLSNNKREAAVAEINNIYTKNR